MSAEQWAGLMLGDEAYAGSENFFHLKQAVQDVYGYPFVVPTHQGRGAEHIISQVLIKPGDVIPGNMYFTTTRLHQELAGGRFVDVIVDEAHDPVDESPFKGNVDVVKLRAGLRRARRRPHPVRLARGHGEHGRRAAGQRRQRPCGPGAVRRVRDQALPRQDPHRRERLVRPAARGRLPGHPGAAERARDLRPHRRRLVQRQEGRARQHRRLPRPARPEVFEEARNLCVVYEGLDTYGGLAGRDMEAMSIGIRESVDEDHLQARVGQVEYLGNTLRDGGVPIVLPIGGHAVFLDAARFLPQVPQDEFPAQRLAGEIYLEAGVRSMERGIVSAGRDAETGEHNRPRLELVRLTLPRRVYTQAHMDVAAEAVLAVWDRREAVRGLEMTFEPKHLRFFQARFTPLA